MGCFVPNKEAATITESIVHHWVQIFGRMETLHSDRGREFLNEELTRICEYLDVKCSATAAYSPNMNGCNERNHAIVDRMMEKMLFTDPSMKPELALSWSIAAKNSLENYQGFSPSQIVFGANPSLPAVYSSGPPGLEEVSMSQAVADQINAMHMAREAFVECESDRVIKIALKKRLYVTSDEVYPGDWVYFKNQRKWEGPVKITTKDGKLLYCVRAGKLLTINVDHSVVVKSGDEVVPQVVVPKDHPVTGQINQQGAEAHAEEQQVEEMQAEVEHQQTVHDESVEVGQQHTADDEAAAGQEGHGVVLLPEVGTVTDTPIDQQAQRNHQPSG